MTDNHKIIKELQTKMQAKITENTTLLEVIGQLEAQHQNESKTYLRLIEGLKESVEKLRNDKTKAISILENLNCQSNNRLKSYVNQVIEILE